MSHTRVKIKYEEEGNYGSTTEETLYCHHNHTCDIVSFYYGDGDFLTAINEFSSNNLWTAMEKLMYYHKHKDDVEYWDKEDREKIANYKVKKVNDNSDNLASALLSIYDSLKLADNGHLDDGETLTEMMFRKMKAYDVDLNKELGFTHLAPVKKEK